MKYTAILCNKCWFGLNLIMKIKTVWKSSVRMVLMAIIILQTYKVDIEKKNEHYEYNYSALDVLFIIKGSYY